MNPKEQEMRAERNNGTLNYVIENMSSVFGLPSDWFYIRKTKNQMYKQALRLALDKKLYLFAGAGLMLSSFLNEDHSTTGTMCKKFENELYSDKNRREIYELITKYVNHLEVKIDLINKIKENYNG